jgi:hypothetical protein
MAFNHLMLPQYQVANGFDVSPISNALDSNRENALAQNRLGLQRRQVDLAERADTRAGETHGLQMAQMRRQSEQEEARMVAGRIQYIQGLPPEQRMAAWKTARQQPGFRDLPAEFDNFEYAAPQLLGRAAEYVSEADKAKLGLTRAQTGLAYAQAEKARREAAEGGSLGKQFMPYYDPETGITYAVQAGPRGPQMTPLLTPEAPPQASQGVPTDQMPGAGAARFAQPGIAPPQQRRPLRAIGTTVAGDTMFDRFGNPIRNVGQNIANAASMKEQGQLQGKAAFDLGTAVQKGEEGIRLIGELETHPGRATGTGFSSKIDPRNYFAGTDATNFRVRVEQLQGQVFLEAYEALKGAGQITEIEGAKAERAKARLSTAQSDEEFLVALKELKDVLSAGVERAKRRAAPVGGAQPTPSGVVRLKYNPATGELEQ